MQQREKILAASAAAVVLLWLGLPAWNRIIVAPVEEKRRELADVEAELADQLKEVGDVKRAGLLLEEWRRRSLPADPLDAQRLYLGWLTDLAQMSGFNDLKVTPGRRIPNGEIFTSVLVTLEGEIQFSQLRNFLYSFYRIDLAHRLNQIDIKPAENRGAPPFHVTMTIEGLCLNGADSRTELFPQAVLKEGFQSSTESRQVFVVDAQDFPTEPPFLVQIGHEYLNVTQLQDHRWTVAGGRDFTATSKHESGDVIQLVPIKRALTDRPSDLTRDGYARNPFIKPVPKTPEITTPRPVVAAVKDLSAAETYLAACITKDDEPQAWLYRDSNRKKLVVRKGEMIEVGEVAATVVDIQSSLVVLRNDEGYWQLKMGDTLGGMQRLPDYVPLPVRDEQPTQSAAE